MRKPFQIIRVFGEDGATPTVWSPKKMKMIIWVLWPAFSAAGIAEVVFFTLIDPQQLYLLGEPINVSSMTAYSIGFLLFWLLCTCACLMTYLMLPAEVKRLLSQHADEHPDLSRRNSRADQ